MSGFGNGQFEITTASNANSFVAAPPAGSFLASSVEAFYLTMNVAIGGTNGWFPDGPEKPWLDASATAPRDFLQVKDQWYYSWPQDIERCALVM
ncbi:hypothetical protein C8J57DRAFT_1725686 [Mycena rebaudengoi]|nr:hypothetical protein C8J57DRAFT_1725686 [Mycena rebaudengoi]